MADLIKALIDDASSQWSLATNRNITFSEGASNAPIQVSLDDLSASVGGSSDTELAFWLDINTNWTTVNSWCEHPNNDAYYDIYKNILHEFGHVVLGWGHTDYGYEDPCVMGASTNVKEFTDCEIERIKQIYNPFKDVTVKNSFGEGLMKIDNGDFETIPASGKFIDNEWRESSFPHSFTAKLTQEKSPVTFTQRFQDWTAPNGTDNLTISVPLPTTSNPTYVANYEDEYDITFTNYHPRGETGGKIKVDDVEIDSPANVHAYGLNKIKGKAIDHYIDQIHFTFKTWDTQGGTNREYQFSQSGHANYVAKFEGKPTNSYRNQRFNSKVVGQPIIVYWNQHPSTNVTKYKVYRKPKYGSESCVKTVTRTGGSSHTYTFTDPDMTHTNSSSSYDLYYYDVRAYYDNYPLSSGKYSDPDFRAVYAEIGGPEKDDNQHEQRRQEISYEYGISNYPNPYNPTTTISYNIKEQGNVQITVYDALGRKVADLVNEIKQPGSYNAMFNGSNLTSGIYFYTMKVNDFMETKKMLLTK